MGGPSHKKKVALWTQEKKKMDMKADDVWGPGKERTNRGSLWETRNSEESVKTGERLSMKKATSA